MAGSMRWDVVRLDNWRQRGVQLQHKPTPWEPTEHGQRCACTVCELDLWIDRAEGTAGGLMASVTCPGRPLLTVAAKLEEAMLPAPAPAIVVDEPAEEAPDWRTATVTRRQLQVWREVARGGSNKEIAAALGCAFQTVHAHVYALFAVLGARNRAQLAAFYVARYGLPEAAA